MPETATQAEDAVKLDTSPTMAMTTLYGAAIGPIGSDYYLPLFERFEAAGRGTVSWNGSACLYSLNWLIFRGLWGAALAFVGALVGLSVVLIAAGLLAFDWPMETLTVALLVSLAVACIVTGLWGNALLYNHSRTAMMAAVANNKTLALACAELGQRASSRTRFLRILGTNAALIALAGVAAMMLQPGDNTTTDPTAEAVPAVLGASQPASETAPAASGTVPVATAATSVASGMAPVASSVTPMAIASSPAASAAASPASNIAAAASSTTARRVNVAMPAASTIAPAASATGPAASSAAAPTSAAHRPTNSATPSASAAAKAAASAASTPGTPLAQPVQFVTRFPAKYAAAFAAASAPSQAVSAPAPKPAVAASKVVKAAQPAAATKTRPTASAARPTQGFYVNAGLFADADNARRTLARLTEAGLPATAQHLESSHGARTRLRVGPFATRARAEAAIKQIKNLKLDAVLAKPAAGD